MYDFLNKRGLMLAFLVGLLVVVVFMVTALSGLSAAGFDGSTDLAAQGRDKVAEMDFFNTGLWLTIVLLIVTVGISLIFGVVQLFKFPKESIKSLIGIAALVVLFLIFYSTATMETGPRWEAIFNDFGVDEGSNKLITAGIWTTIVIGVIAIFSAIIAEVRNLFK